MSTVRGGGYEGAFQSRPSSASSSRSTWRFQTCSEPESCPRDNQSRAIWAEALRRKARLLGRLEADQERPVSVSTRRTAPTESSTAIIRPSDEKQPHGPPIAGPSVQVPTRHSRQPPAFVKSQRPSGLKVGVHWPGTGASRRRAGGGLPYRHAELGVALVASRGHPLAIGADRTMPYVLLGSQSLVARAAIPGLTRSALGQNRESRRFPHCRSRPLFPRTPLP